MYALFAGIALGPLLGGLLLYRWGRRRPGRRRLAACIAALFMGAPFVLVSHYGRIKAPTEDTAEAPPVKDFKHWDNGWAARRPQQVLKGRGVIGLSLLTVGVGCGLMGPRRREAGVLVAIAATIAVILFLPPVCGSAIRLSGAEWIVMRLEALLGIVMVGLGVGASALLLESRLPRWWMRSAMSVGVVIFGAWFSNTGPPFDWSTYLRAVRSPETVPALYWLEPLREFRGFFRQYIPAGATVLADGQTQLWLTMLHDCHGTVVWRGGGVPDRETREQDTAAMLWPTTPWPVRRDLLRRYEIRHFMHNSRVLTDPSRLAWTEGHLAGPPRRSGPFTLIPLAVE